jgi:hypothetical protein
LNQPISCMWEWFILLNPFSAARSLIFLLGVIIILNRPISCMWELLE